MNLLPTLLACAVCAGGSDAKIGPAMNAAIFLMLGCIGSVLLAIGYAGYSIARRGARQTNDPLA